MNRQILLLAITAAALSSCTTAYKTGQTPDDVYFSPVRPQDEYVRVKEEEDHKYRYDDEYYDDRYLRMKVQNRTQWNYLDDWYGYDRYSYGYNRYYGTYYNPYTSWNYYHNPYCKNQVIAYNPKQITTTVNVAKPRAFNLAGYVNPSYNQVNNSVKMDAYKVGKVNRQAYSNSNTTFSNIIKQIFTGSSNNIKSSSNSSSTPSRSYSPSSSSGSSGSGGSSGGSSGGGGGASRPSRGN
jgi:uncharacterized membrane protein YgcG